MSGLSVVFVEQISARSLIVFEISNVSHLIQNKSVGEFVKSCTFKLNYTNSIGLSTWELLLFPNGQYDCNGIPDEQTSVYLKVVKCENMSEELKLDVKVQIGGHIGRKQNQSFCFSHASTTWTRTKLMNVNALKNYQGNTAVFSLHLTEHSKNTVSYHPINIVNFKYFVFVVLSAHFYLCEAYSVFCVHLITLN